MRRPAEYSHDVFQAIAARDLMRAGLELHPGEFVRYIVINADARRPAHRVKAIELYDPSDGYDRSAYLRYLLMAMETMLSPFGYTYQRLFDFMVRGVAQRRLDW